MAEITIDTWLYGESLAAYAKESSQGTFANLKVSLPTGSCISDLLHFLGLPTEARGITFINGNLSAMPGLQPDLGHALQDGDRVAFFHLNTMWPFQYRMGSAMAPEMKDAMQSMDDGGMHHSYQK